jgi:nucleotide-binding universal stress UspA family protein
MNVLLAHDGSAQASKALEMAVQLASKSGGKLDVVTVVPDLCLSTEELSEAECNQVAMSLAAEAKGQMRKVEEALASRGVAAGIIIKNGRPAEEIAKAAREVEAEVVVVGSSGRHGASKFLLGSVSSRVVELCENSVFIVK